MSQTPTAAIAARVRQLRIRHGWTAEALARMMAAVGVPWTRIVVTKLETGRRPSVSVEELLALATVLHVAPINLMLPIDAGEQAIAVTPARSRSAAEVREWIRGRSPLPGQDPRVYFSEVPPTEFGSAPND